MFLFLLVFFSGCCDADRPQVWMAPPTWVDKDRVIFSDDAEWDSVKKRVDVFKFYRHFLSDEPNEVLEKAVRTCVDNDIAIAVEINGVKHPVENLKHIKERVEKYGGKLDYVDIDNMMGILMDAGWIGKTMHMREMERPATMEEAAQELADWIVEAGKCVPDAKIGVIECVWRYSFDEFPGTDPNKTFKDNNPCHGDLRQAMDMLIAKLAARGKKIDFFHGEHARLAIMQIAEGTDTDKYGKLKRLEDYFKCNHIEFGVLYADESAANWWPDSVKQNQDAVVASNMAGNVAAHWANGGRVDHVILQSWNRHPSKMVPENQPYTFTNVVKRVLDNFGAKGKACRK